MKNFDSCACRVLSFVVVFLAVFVFCPALKIFFIYYVFMCFCPALKRRGKYYILSFHSFFIMFPTFFSVSSKERLSVTTQTHKLHLFGVISFVKRQNDTKTTVKRLKTMKNEMSYLLFGWVVVQCLEESFLEESFFQVLNNNSIKQEISHLIFHRF